MPHLNKQEEKIREEWNEAIYEIGIDTFPNGEPSYSTTADKIADWWLNKLQEELTRESGMWRLALTHLPEEYRNSVIATYEKLVEHSLIIK